VNHSRSHRNHWRHWPTIVTTLRPTLNLFSGHQNQIPRVWSCYATWGYTCSWICHRSSCNRHRSAARAPEIDSVTGELISGNMAAVVLGSYFGLENSIQSHASSSSLAHPFSFVSRFPRRCNQIERLKICGNEWMKNLNWRLIANVKDNLAKR